jgi:hypothetical protein
MNPPVNGILEMKNVVLLFSKTLLSGFYTIASSTKIYLE